MLDDFLMILNQVFMMFILIGAGYIVTKLGLITKRGAKQMTSVLLVLVTPAVIINAFEIPFDKTKLIGMSIAFAAIALSTIIGILVGKLVFKKEPKDRQSVYRFAITYSNAGFMAIPLIRAVLGQDAVVYGIMGLIVHQIFVWTHGVMLMSSKDKISLKRIFINPGIIGVGIASIIFFCSFNLPLPIHGAIEMLAGLNTPLAMIIIGSFMANVNLKSALAQKEIYLATTIRLIVIPLLTILSLHWFKLPGILYKACLISASTPVAANTSLFSARFSRDTELAGELVAFSTICSVLTMPLILMLAELKV